MGRNAAAQTRLRERRIAEGLCPRCGKTPPETERSCCRPCLDAASRRSKSPVAVASRRRRATQLRSAVFAAYGDKCVCCGEDRRAFLTIDHIKGDGAKHRREVVGGRGFTDAFYRWIVRSGFPADLRLLCYNCNCGRERNGGVCPHEEERAGRVVPLRAVE